MSTVVIAFRRFGVILGAVALGSGAMLSVFACGLFEPYAAARLADARTELESIARAPGQVPGQTERPPVPVVRSLGLDADEQRWVEAAARSSPDGWTDRERQRLRAIVTEHHSTLDVLGSRLEPVSADQLLERSRPVLGAVQLLGISNRLDAMEGREDTFLTGIETRLEIAQRLAAQPGVPGSVLANAVFGTVLEDVHLALTSPRTSPATLARLAALLDDWSAHHPSPAAVFAQEMLPLVDPATHPDEAPDDLAAFAEEAVRVARACRDHACGSTLASFARADDRHRNDGIPAFLWPNLSVAMMKLETFDALATGARVALLTRLSAERAGNYPGSLEELEGTTSEELAVRQLAYDLTNGGAAIIRVTDPRLAEDLRTSHRRDLTHLSSWTLPPIEAAIH